MKQKRGLAVFLLIGFMIIMSISCTILTIRLAEAQTIPKEAKIHNQLGNDYCDKEEFEKGVAEYEKAIKLYPQYSDALYNAGLTSYLDIKDYAKAIVYFKQFIQVEGNSGDAKQVKKWLVDAGKKLAAQKSTQPKNQQVAQVDQGKSSPPESNVKKESSQQGISPSSVKPAGQPQVTGQAGQPPQDTAQSASAPQQAVQAAVQPPQEVVQAITSPSQQAVQTAAQPPQEVVQAITSPSQQAVQAVAPPSGEVAQTEPQSGGSVREAGQQPISKEEGPAVVAAVPPLPNASQGQKVQQSTPPSRKEEAQIYKGRGNNFNNQGKPEEAVKEYAKALQIYPEYTDVLYNIAKTYDFNLKDYANAIHYYKLFLQHEPPASRDAAQVKIWLGRAEESLQALNKPVQGSSKAVQSVAQNTLQTTRQKAMITSTPIVTAKTPGGKVLTRGKKVGDFYIKEFLPTTPVNTVPVNIVPMEIRGEANPVPPEPREKAESAESKVMAESKEKAEFKDAVLQQSAANAQSADAQSPVQTVAAAPLPAVSPSGSPAQAWKAQSTGNREILIETIIPKDLRAPDLIPMVMSQMQKEITEVFAQARAQSPEKLAELYLSKIQSDILPSGERVSSFRLGGKELADLPNIRILTEEEKKDLEKEKWDLIRTRKSPARLKDVLMLLRDGYKVVPR
jgi:tetratricopeptide (TPR) repeat protein